MMDIDDVLVEEPQDAHEDETVPEVSSERRGSKEDRRCGMDRRCIQLPFEGPERRKQKEPERRSAWDRRRGPGIRRSDDRRQAEEGEMNDEQFEYLKAIEEYKKVNRKPFPSFTEILEIVKALGYRKVDKPVPISTLKIENDE